MRPFALLMIAAVLSIATESALAQSQPALSWDDKPWSGLLLRDEGNKVLVSWILPGPLQGTTFDSPFMTRGDEVTAINGQPMTAEQFSDLVHASQPGDIITLSLIRTGGDAHAAVPAAGAKREPVEVKLILARKADWCGPIDLPRDQAAFPTAAQTLGISPEPTPLETFLHAHLDAQQLRQPVDQLIELFRDTQNRRLGYNTLSRVAAVFYRPTALPQLQRRITDPLPRLLQQPQLVLREAAANLDLQAPALSELPPWTDAQQMAQQLIDRIAVASLLRAQAFAQLPPSTQQSLPVHLRELIQTQAKPEYISGHDNPQPLIQAMQASIHVDHQALLDAAAAVAPFIQRMKLPPDDLPIVPTPAALADAVVGQLLAAVQVGDLWFIVGGRGPNRYDLTQLAGVIDLGGNDVYLYPADLRPPVQVIVDVAGDDRYTSAISGPASACMGVSLLVDYAGDDLYEGGSLSCGAAVMGAAILVDWTGSDRYLGTSWAQGAGVYGLGALIDAGGGHDQFTAHVASQGIGGPRGFGLLLNGGGNDIYRATGAVPSAYGTPATFYSMSQGIGYGIRGYDSGGVGVLSDQGGHDRYEAGEFSQGGGYFLGLGILHDRAGHDLYYGDRYSQGFGCHQAHGVLADDGGNDTYWARTAASQGGAWDIGMGLLIDRAGHDAYRADGLSQGGAAMQGIAWLIDLEGNDRYIATGATHGQSSGNSYHYQATGCTSWSLLLDAGGGSDTYSTSRPNNQVLTPAQINETNPQDSGLHGLFIDQQDSLTID